ncbi:3-deoxy-manno-octulosonate cytidylyltransferase [Caldithrix abyssi]|nr:3-deoxy-manno-octulosonate cytidylyltransferase [Caldithrix abyssi]
MTDYLIVIPARYQSSRFPGKPLADIHGKSMILRVWEKCVEAASADKVLVATDDYKILDHCKENDIQVELTDENCLTGTDRLYEVAQKRKAVVYINVQGDEPLVSPLDIKAVIKASQKEPGLTFNAMCPINSEADFRSSNIPKVVTRKDGRLLYMSRAPIPTNKQLGFENAMKQVCIYAFPRDVLITFGSMKEKTPLESMEDLEILRLLEIGYKVKMVEVSGSSVAVDTPQDLERVRSLISD